MHHEPGVHPRQLREDAELFDVLVDDAQYASEQEQQGGVRKVQFVQPLAENDWKEMLW